MRSSGRGCVWLKRPGRNVWTISITAAAPTTRAAAASAKYSLGQRNRAIETAAPTNTATAAAAGTAGHGERDPSIAATTGTPTSTHRVAATTPVHHTRPSRRTRTAIEESDQWPYLVSHGGANAGVTHRRVAKEPPDADFDAIVVWIESAFRLAVVDDFNNRRWPVSAKRLNRIGHCLVHELAT